MNAIVVRLVALGLAVSVAPAVAQMSTAFQINAAHDGVTRFGSELKFPLQKRWSVDFGMSVSYPVIADGRILVVAAKHGGPAEVEVHALDASDGRRLWSNAYAGMMWMSHTYGDGRLYTVDLKSTLRALDPSTGALIWETTPGYYPSTSTAPVYSDGMVYFYGGTNNATLYAVDAATGTIVWSRSYGNRSNGAISFHEGAVYVSFGCDDYAKLEAKTGEVLWDHDTPNCDGGWGLTGPVSETGLHSFQFRAPTHIIDRQTGDIVRRYKTRTLPALSGQRRFTLREQHLEMVDETTGKQGWAFAGDGQLASSPIVVNDVVFVGSVAGNFYAVDAATGAEVWSTNVGSKIPHSNERVIARPLNGLAAGEGLVAVPSVGRLTVFESR